MKSVGIQTLVMKLRLVQSLPGRNLTRVDFFAPIWGAWRTIFRFLENGFGTVEERYELAEVNQKDSRYAAEQQFHPQLPIRCRQRWRETGEDSVTPLWIWARIAFVIQTLEALE